MTKKTAADIADLIHGTKLYQDRARTALPILVRQAEHGIPRIVYQDLARELQMPNPRNLDYVLGSIGRTLVALGKQWGESIPPIECIVVNKHSGLPGRGIQPFLTTQKWSDFNHGQRHQLVDRQIERVLTYPKWRSVLAALKLPPPPDLDGVVGGATGFGGGGESEEHRRLKEWVASNPVALGLGSDMAKGETEWCLASGDAVDVLFRRGKEWIAVEVKGINSPVGDLARGLFQCIKYQATLEAEGLVKDDGRKVRTVLAVGGKLTSPLAAVKSLLGLDVVEGLGKK